MALPTHIAIYPVKYHSVNLFDKIKYYLFSNEPINNPVLPNLYHI